MQIFKSLLENKHLLLSTCSLCNFFLLFNVLLSFLVPQPLVWSLTWKCFPYLFCLILFPLRLAGSWNFISGYASRKKPILSSFFSYFYLLNYILWLIAFVSIIRIMTDSCGKSGIPVLILTCSRNTSFFFFLLIKILVLWFRFMYFMVLRKYHLFLFFFKIFFIRKQCLCQGFF